MNKAQLAEKIAAARGLPKDKASAIVETIFTAIAAALEAGGYFHLANFGTFMIVQRKARVGRNPRTGEALQIPAAKRVKFKVGKGLKAGLNR